MRKVDGLLALAAALLLGGTANVSAQRQSTSQFGTQGPAGQIGSNLTGSIVGQGTTQGGSLGGAGGQPFGNMQGGSPLGGTATAAGAATGGFVGRSDNTGGFVGDQRVGQQAGAAATQRQFGGAAAGRTNQVRGGNQAAARGQGQAERHIVRPRQEIAFQYPGRDISVLSGEVTGRFSRLGRRDASLPGVTIEITAQGAAVLTGTVATEDAKKLAEILVSLEPGIRSVVNQLAIAAVPLP